MTDHMSFEERGKLLLQEKEKAEMTEEQQKQNALVELESLRSMAKIGMSHVDMGDIRPPQIVLVQKMSDIESLTDTEGKTPKFGQFFDTGKRKIMDSFDCYVVFAKKSTWMDRRKPEKGPQPMYTMIGVMKEDMSVFGMMLRSSAQYSLNNLFSSAVSQNYPMFVFNAHVEVKELSNDQGKWWIPVFRVGKIEQDAEILGNLIKLAKRFDSQAETISLDEDAPKNAYVTPVEESTEAEDVSDQINDINGEPPF
jgi:hypothetical protein